MPEKAIFEKRRQFWNLDLIDHSLKKVFARQCRSAEEISGRRQLIILEANSVIEASLRRRRWLRSINASSSRTNIKLGRAQTPSRHPSLSIIRSISHPAFYSRDDTILALARLTVSLLSRLRTSTS